MTNPRNLRPSDTNAYVLRGRRLQAQAIYAAVQRVLRGLKAAARPGIDRASRNAPAKVERDSISCGQTFCQSPRLA